ncbi:hypothetical protein CJU90_2447 [Yarrowia sp. C11]|nr:hypothetical protein CKK34_6475 [Yarrowia sp. E02]KAG5372359.1 hypothetical protein CJU90_2447 [Yarrowia sp. C11]
MPTRRTPILISIVIAAIVVYATYTIAHSVYQHILIGNVDSSVVFEYRTDTYVIDTEGTCKTPAWVGNSGTLVTTGDCIKDGWKVEKADKNNALAVAHNLCAKGHKMNCLLVSNTEEGSHRSLDNLVRLSLAKYANEDVAWNCGAGCDLFPAQFSYCIAFKQLGATAVPDGFLEESDKCKLLQHQDLSL